jgi:preprotein translocase subunit SecA
MFDRILRMGEGREAKRFQRIVVAVDALGADIESLTDAELRGRTDRLPCAGSPTARARRPPGRGLRRRP